MATMKAVRFHDFGGSDVMVYDEIPRPEPGEGELLVRVHAASANPVDYKIRSGQYPAIKREQLPIVMGRDVAGTVESCGAGVRAFRPGEAVYALIGRDRGSFAEYVVLKEDEAAAKPAKLDFPQAAAVPLAGLTAWQGLFDHGGLGAGQRVLIHGGAGGVGHFAVQFAKAKGAYVVTTVWGGDRDFVRELGADEAIDYKAQRFEEIARDIDVVFDLIAGETQDRSWAVLKPGGILVSTLREPPADKAAAHRARGTRYMAQPNAAQLGEIARLIDEGKVRPVVAAVFPFEEARQAEDRLETGHVRGKIVLKVTG